MNSSTRPSDGRTRARVAVLAIMASLFVTAHVVLDGTAEFAERRLGAFLWRQQDTLRLFSPHNYVNRGAGRLLIYGPSEAREAFLPEELAPGVPGLEPYQNAQSIGTLEDGLVIFEYIERAYGPAAVPDVILLGITPRFIANIRSEPSPLFRMISQYSPHFNVMEGTHPPRLVPRSTIESLRARAALLSLEPDRYRRGLFAVASHMATSVVPSLASNRRIWGPIRQAKYIDGRLGSDDSIKAWLVEPGSYWEQVHAWDPQQDRTEITRQLQLLTDYTTRHGIQLFVVNLPELSWNRDLYDPWRYASYMNIVRAALGSTPFLDLRTFAPDEEFFDSSHTTWAGSKRVSQQVAAFIREHRVGGTDVRSVW